MSPSELAISSRGDLKINIFQIRRGSGVAAGANQAEVGYLKNRAD